MRLGFRYRSGLRAQVLLSVAALSGTILMAQDEPKVVASSVPTLHVYTNLVQIPTLVLSMTDDRVSKPIVESRFSINIDSGRWFRVTHVRQEGDDPISLSILLDVNGDTTALLPKLGDAIGNLVPLSLHPKDRVSVYALDCSLVRSQNDAPPYRAVLQSGVAAALEQSMLRKNTQDRKNCELRGHLWDGLAQVAVALSDLPGRRVILVVTDGHDVGSKHSWNEVREFAQVKGIAVFALNYAQASSMVVGNYRSSRGGNLSSGDESLAVGNGLTSVCELSGGIVMRMNDPVFLSKSLERFIAMLRERYIVEFPRPANSTAGEHVIEVKIDKGIYKIRPSGVSLPLPDPALMADPTTIQAGPLQTPEQGTRKVMNKEK
jgi:hypothetical protein